MQDLTLFYSSNFWPLQLYQIWFSYLSFLRSLIDGCLYCVISARLVGNNSLKDPASFSESFNHEFYPRHPVLHSQKSMFELASRLWASQNSTNHEGLGVLVQNESKTYLTY